MTRDEFRNLLLKATKDVLECTRKYVANPIPDSVEYRVFPNQSYDRHPDGHILTDYPDESGLLILSGADEVVAFLWRDSRVPAWINVQIEDATDTLTFVDLVCCGRYTDDEQCMYYTVWKMGPFGVKGPAVPPQWKWGEDNEKFDLHWQRHRREGGG